MPHFIRDNCETMFFQDLTEDNATTLAAELKVKRRHKHKCDLLPPDNRSLFQEAKISIEEKQRKIRMPDAAAAAASWSLCQTEKLFSYWLSQKIALQMKLNRGMGLVWGLSSLARRLS